MTNPDQQSSIIRAFRLYVWNCVGAPPSHRLAVCSTYWNQRVGGRDLAATHATRCDHIKNRLWSLVLFIGLPRKSISLKEFCVMRSKRGNTETSYHAGTLKTNVD